MTSVLERLREHFAPDIRVERELAAGGMGTVFLAHDVRLDRPVAIKILREEFVNPWLAARFEREAQILARLSHPNVVPVHAAGRIGDLPYYVMDYLGGETLAVRLSRGTLSEAETVRLGRDLLAGLDLAHRNHVVHRDIKPDNIFLTDTGAVLVDFGVARLERSTDPNRTATGMLIGTLGYMGPEQATGAPVDGRADLYVLGIVLFEALTGRRGNFLGVDLRKVDWTGVPRGLRKILQRALAPAPDDRWQDAASFSRALGRSQSAVSRPAVKGAVVVVALALLTPLIIPHPPVPMPPPPPEIDLALAPFEGTGDLGPRLARYTATRLQWYRRLEVRALDAKATRARFTLEGVIGSQAGRPVLALTVRDSQRVTYAGQVAGDPGDILGWSRAAGDSTVKWVFPELYLEFHQLADRGGSAQLPAIDEFIKGTDAFQRDAFVAADDHFTRALEIDSSFIQAAWRLALVRRFRRIPFEEDLQALYRRHRDAFPTAYRRLIEGMIEPDLLRRFAIYREVVDSYPRSAEVRFVYGDELYHSGPLVGIPLDTARVQMQQAAALAPYQEQAPAYDHLLWGDLRLGHRAAADSALGLRLGIHDPGEAEEANRRRFLRLAHAARFHPAWAGVQLWIRSLWIDSLFLAGSHRYGRLGYTFDIPWVQLRLGRILAAKAPTATMRANGFRMSGLALMGLGRPGEALINLDSAAAQFHEADQDVQRAEWRVLPEILGLPGVPAREFERGDQDLRRLAGGGNTRAAWAIAFVAIARGDTAAASGFVATVRRGAVQDPAAARLARHLDAALAAAGGRFADALTISEPLLSYPPVGATDDPFLRSALYLGRRTWYLRVGDTANAARTGLWYENSDFGLKGWLQSAIQPGEIDGLVAMRARVLRAELELAKGASDRACADLRRVHELWLDAEPAARSLSEAADILLRRCAP